MGGPYNVPWCVQVQALGTQKEQLQKRVIEVERERGLFFRHMEELRRHSTTLQEDNGRLLTELNKLRQAMKQVGFVKGLVQRPGELPCCSRSEEGCGSGNRPAFTAPPRMHLRTELAALRQAVQIQMGLSGSAWQQVAVASSGQWQWPHLGSDLLTCCNLLDSKEVLFSLKLPYRMSHHPPLQRLQLGRWQLQCLQWPLFRRQCSSSPQRSLRWAEESGVAAGGWWGPSGDHSSCTANQQVPPCCVLETYVQILDASPAPTGCLDHFGPALHTLAGQAWSQSRSS